MLEGKRLRAAFVVGGLYSKSNGVAWIMKHLADALGRAECVVDVFAADCVGRGSRPSARSLNLQHDGERHLDFGLEGYHGQPVSNGS